MENEQINEMKKTQKYEIATGERDNVRVWGAEILGKDPRWGYNRNFCSQKIFSSSSSKHQYYSYYMNMEEGKIYEWRISGAYKNKGGFLTVENGEIRKISAEEMAERVN